MVSRMSRKTANNLIQIAQLPIKQCGNLVFLVLAVARLLPITITGCSKRAKQTLSKVQLSSLKYAIDANASYLKDLLNNLFYNRLQVSFYWLHSSDPRDK